MPSADAPASVTRDGEALRFAGALVRDQVPALWRQALQLAAGARRFDLTAVSRVDSAGVALLAELAGLASRTGGGTDGGAAATGAAMGAGMPAAAETGRLAFHGVEIDGNPAGLAELRAAYRLKPDLDFA